MASVKNESSDFMNISSFKNDIQNSATNEKTIKIQFNSSVDTKIILSPVPHAYYGYPRYVIGNFEINVVFISVTN